MTVCNGEYFLRECLECVYPYAHKIIIAEGATAKWGNTHRWKTPRSQDNTINIIKQFPDPNNKVVLIQNDSFYKNETQQSNLTLKAMPGDTDYIWVLDADELYTGAGIKHVIKRLRNKNFTYVEFNMYNFFKNIHTIAYDSGKGWGYNTPIPRIFKYYKGSLFQSGRGEKIPPTILDNKGRNVKKIRPLFAGDNKTFMYHYSYVLDKQVREKIYYYSKLFKRRDLLLWYKNVWKRWDDNRKLVEVKHSVHPTVRGGKTKRFTGEHPGPIKIRYGIE